jgi:hypothetical protein
MHEPASVVFWRTSMKQGKDTPPAIKCFIIKTKKDASELTNHEIADKIQAKFGETIDQTTVGRILKKNNVQISKHIKDAGSELELEKQIRQKSHIKNLQVLARSTIDTLPDELPDMENSDELFKFNWKIVTVIKRLTDGSFDWIDLSYHLGDEGKQIEKLLNGLDEILPSPRYLTQYKNELEDAFLLIKTKGLKTISENSDTTLWEYHGLNQRCPNCPDPNYEPYGTRLEDYTGNFGPYPPMTFKDFQQNVP